MAPGPEVEDLASLRGAHWLALPQGRAFAAAQKSIPEEFLDRFFVADSIGDYHGLVAQG